MRTLPPEDGAEWLTPQQAIQILAPNGDSVSVYLWREALLERLRGDMVSATAREVTYSGPSASKHQRQFWPLIGPRTWDHVNKGDPVWATGTLTFSEMKSAYDTLTIRCFDVRFDPEEVRKMVPPGPAIPQTRLAQVQAEETTLAAPAQNKSGRPPKDWWPDLWVEICRQIYAGELIPKRQADVERAMQNWAAMQGHDVSERTVRTAAKKLFDAVFREGKK